LPAPGASFELRAHAKRGLARHTLPFLRRTGRSRRSSRPANLELGTYVDVGTILGIFIARPYLALVPAGVFALMFVSRRRPATLIAALAWFAYFPYEQAMSLRLLCSGECNIRVDLLLLYPLLVVVSMLAAYAHIKSRQTRGRA
jgi:hypothetical protein